MKYRRRTGSPPRGVPAGFSLLEMLVALAVAGILFFVALPGYQSAVVKSMRSAARAVLLDVVSRQEQFFLNHKRYAVSLDDLGLPEPYYIDGQSEPVAAGAASYLIGLDLLDEAYSGVTATPVNRQARDAACMAFSISTIGVRAVSGTLAGSPAECW